MESIRSQLPTRNLHAGDCAVAQDRPAGDLVPHIGRLVTPVGSRPKIYVYFLHKQSTLVVLTKAQFGRSFLNTKRC